MHGYSIGVWDENERIENEHNMGPLHFALKAVAALKIDVLKVKPNRL